MPWKIWRHIKEAELRGDKIVTQAELGQALREFARLSLAMALMVLTLGAVGAAIAWEIDNRSDRERDESFAVICEVQQDNAESVADFANAVVKLVRPTPPPSQRVRDVRDTAAAVRDRNKAFAAARCTSREDLARLVARDVLAPPTSEDP